jgi:hypothetical protein
MSGRNPRGSIVCPSRPINIGGGATIAGPFPGLVVYIKAGSSRMCREFKRFCERYSIHARPVQEVIDGRPDAWECVAADVEALERLIAADFVVHWHYIMSTRVPLMSGGSGQMTPRASLSRRDTRMPRAERLANAERERRAMLDPEQKLDIELAEARELPGPWRPHA